MKAVVWNGPSGDVALQDMQIPKAGPGEVVIEVKASGLCRSDVAIARRETRRKPRLRRLL